jgi:hypothetical protein
MAMVVCGTSSVEFDRGYSLAQPGTGCLRSGLLLTGSKSYSPVASPASLEMEAKARGKWFGPQTHGVSISPRPLSHGPSVIGLFVTDLLRHQTFGHPPVYLPRRYLVTSPGVTTTTEGSRAQNLSRLPSSQHLDFETISYIAPTASKKTTRKKAKPRKAPVRDPKKVLKNKEKRDRCRGRGHVTAAIQAHRDMVRQARARGDPPERPCHLCQGAHWSDTCEKYGEWKAKMDKKRRDKDGGQAAGGGGAAEAGVDIDPDYVDLDMEDS